MTEIDQQSQAHIGYFQIIADLSLVFGGQIGNRFDPDDDLAEAYEIRFISLLQRHSLVLQLQLHLFLERDTPQFKLPDQRFLVYRLQKAGACRPRP